MKKAAQVAPGGSETSCDAIPRVVGIGASAGGLESLEDFFDNLPADSGLAFVVVQHLSPDFRSMMSELLARHTPMPIEMAGHDVAVRPNRVYLLPRRKEITISEGRLQLRDKDPASALTLPIDVFFRSLAQDQGQRATVIVLSGSGSDGSRGILEVKRAGGLVLAESPESAKFDGMPLSALATGTVDRWGTPGQLAQALTERPAARRGEGEEVDSEDEHEITAEPMQLIQEMLHERYGLDFALYKRSTVSRRVLRRAALQQNGDLEAYHERLRADSEELGLLYHDLLIGVTRFLRDPDAFDVLENRVLPGILKHVPPTEEIRVWVAGCATGEEAYSIAMLLFEQCNAAGREANFRVLATDVDRASLERASQGLYAEAQLEHVSRERRERFFTRRAKGYQISKDLRQHIVFAPHNVTRDAPFTRMHLITCRNLLIYLNPEVQRTVMSLFHFGLVSGGVLFLGSSESPGVFEEEFVAIDERSRMYRKRRDVRLIEPLRLPVKSKPRADSARLLRDAPTAAPSEPHLLSVYDRLLDRYMPPGFLVDSQRNLVDSFGGAEKILSMGRRRPSTNVLELLEGDLRTVVGGAVQRVLADQSSVRYPGVPTTVGGDPVRVTVAAEGITDRTGTHYVLITLQWEHAQPELDVPALPAETSPSSERRADVRVDMLEAELDYTRETLRATVEEQQTGNEELQATNEELVASNEELQSTNEELHSVNEELYTVNGEYQKKILELRELYNDMQHLLEGTDVGTLFLDRELCIRKFTPRVAGVFHVRNEDVGRNIRHFSHDLDRDDLFELLEAALERGEVVEDEVRDQHGTTFFLRILPYRPPHHGDEASSTSKPGTAAESALVDGVMLSLTDISALDHARDRIRQLSAIVESSEDAIIGKDLGNVIVTWNRGAERLYGYTAEEAIGRSIKLLAPPGYESEMDGFLQSAREGGRVEHVETTRMRKDGALIDVSVTISPIHDRAGKVVGASAIARDITPLKRAQREVEAREERIRLLLDSTAEAIFGLDNNGVCSFCNPACVRLLGYESADQLIGQRIHDLIHHSHVDGTPYSERDCPIHAVLRDGCGTHSDLDVLFRADGSSFHAEYWSHPIRRGDAIEGAVVTFLDITERKRAYEEVHEAAQRRERFLAMLSHELRNPLAAVLGATKVLEDHRGDGVGASKAVRVIDRQSRHMARLLDDLLDVSRITRGGIELRKCDLDLRDPVQLAVEAVQPQLDERGVRLRVELPDEPLPVRGDGTRLQQIVANLLSNAARYSQAQTEAVLRVERDREEIVISVEDQGRGIDPELLPQIFELFVQTDQGLDRSQGGLGVGLALVKQLVELHGGRVHVASEGVNKGSEFVVRLPLQPHAEIAADEAVVDGPPPGGRIVVVEDQPDAREMMKLVLEGRGFLVFEAADGEEGIATIERVHPDVALIDIGLPVLDGFEVARRLRSNRVVDDVLLVALTGYGTREDVAAAEKAGFDEHLTKPADPKRLQELILRRRARSSVAPSMAERSER